MNSASKGTLWVNHYVFVGEGKADMLEEDGYLAEVVWRIYSVESD
jgi:hypothetical protein